MGKSLNSIGGFSSTELTPEGSMVNSPEAFTDSRKMWGWWLDPLMDHKLLHSQTPHNSEFFPTSRRDRSTKHLLWWGSSTANSRGSLGGLRRKHQWWPVDRDSTCHEAHEHQLQAPGREMPWGLGSNKMSHVGSLKLHLNWCKACASTRRSRFSRFWKLHPDLWRAPMEV